MGSQPSFMEAESSTTEIKVTLETGAMEKNQKSWKKFCFLPPLITKTGKVDLK